MSLIRNGVTAVATATIVIALSYLVQRDGAADTRAVRKASQPSASTVNSVMMSTNADGAAVFGMPSAVSAPRRHDDNTFKIAALDTTLTEVVPPVANFMPALPFDDCDTDLTIEPKLAAMVALTIMAPCHLNADFVVRHEDIVFSARTDSLGNAMVTSPVLRSDATFTVTFNNIEEARKTIIVPDVDKFDRAVLQWRGAGSLHLHALEAGARIGDPGHIWSAASHSPEMAQQGRRGFMTRLGTSDAAIPYWSEVYTFPSGTIGRDGQIALQVGAAVTEKNCGRELDAIGAEMTSGRLQQSRTFEIQMPDCTLVGHSIMRTDLF